jgi:hypothetical protein
MRTQAVRRCRRERSAGKLAQKTPKPVVEAVEGRTLAEEHQDALAVHCLDSVLGTELKGHRGKGPRLHPHAANACGGCLTHDDLGLSWWYNDEEAADRRGEFPDAPIAPDALDGLGPGMDGEDLVAVGRQLPEGRVSELLPATRDPDECEVFCARKSSTTDLEVIGPSPNACA